MNRLFICIVAILSLDLSSASAQLLRQRVLPATQPTQVVQTTPGNQMTGQMPGQRDLFLADWISADNQTEIQMNQFAAQHASSQDVKNFAQEMIRDHSDFANKLNQAVANSKAAAFQKNGRTPYAAGYRGTQEAAPATAAPATQEAQQPQATGAQVNIAPAVPTAPATGAAAADHNHAHNGEAGGTTEAVTGQPGVATQAQASPNTWVGGPQQGQANFQREINSQLTAIVEQKLGQKKGEEFDHCFIQGQIACHTHMLATLEVAQNQASPQLKPVLAEAIQVAQKHLSEAESLAKKLQSQASR